MSEPRKPEILQKWGIWWMIRCPGCGLVGRADKDQVMGRVSIDCPECEYHETHELLEGSDE